MSRTRLNHLILSLGFSFLACVGCGDTNQASPTQSASPVLSPSTTASAPPASPGSVARIPARTPVSVNHGPQSFWPNSSWTPPAAKPEPKVETTQNTGAGLFGVNRVANAQATLDPATQIAGRIPVPQPRPDPPPVTSANQGTLLKTGKASWYGPGFHGRQTANQEIYDQNKMTAAMTGVPLGINVRVERVDTGQSIQVRVNDRGPYWWKPNPSSRKTRKGVKGNWAPHRTRVIDLSKAAMQALGGINAGIISVKVYRL